MYRLTDKPDIIYDKVLSRFILQGTPEWNGYLRWLGKGNKPEPKKGNVVVVQPKAPEVVADFKISKELWEDLEKKKTIKDIKEWLKEAFK